MNRNIDRANRRRQHLMIKRGRVAAVMLEQR